MTSRPGPIPTFPSAIRRVLVLRVLKLLADAISRLQTCGGITSDMREDVISENLYIAMEHIHQGSYDDIVNFALRPALPIPVQPHQISIPDFTFYFHVLPRNNRRYLGVEAKIVRGTGTTQAGEYVSDGVCRFVQGKYSLGHYHAVMLGYVVVGPLNKAVRSVKTQMDARSVQTAQRSAFSDARPCWYLPNSYVSQHRQAGANQTLTLLHLFADFS